MHVVCTYRAGERSVRVKRVQRRRTMMWSYSRSTVSRLNRRSPCKHAAQQQQQQQQRAERKNERPSSRLRILWGWRLETAGDPLQNFPEKFPPAGRLFWLFTDKFSAGGDFSGRRSYNRKTCLWGRRYFNKGEEHINSVIISPRADFSWGKHFHVTPALSHIWSMDGTMRRPVQSTVHSDGVTARWRPNRTKCSITPSASSPRSATGKSGAFHLQ